MYAPRRYLSQRRFVRHLNASQQEAAFNLSYASNHAAQQFQFRKGDTTMNCQGSKLFRPRLIRGYEGKVAEIGAGVAFGKSRPSTDAYSTVHMFATLGTPRAVNRNVKDYRSSRVDCSTLRLFSPAGYRAGLLPL